MSSTNESTPPAVGDKTVVEGGNELGSRIIAAHVDIGPAGETTEQQMVDARNECWRQVNSWLSEHPNMTTVDAASQHRWINHELDGKLDYGQALHRLELEVSVIERPVAKAPEPAPGFDLHLDPNPRQTRVYWQGMNVTDSILSVDLHITPQGHREATMRVKVDEVLGWTVEKKDA